MLLAAGIERERMRYPMAAWRIVGSPFDCLDGVLSAYRVKEDMSRGGGRAGMDKRPHVDYEEDVGKGCSETFQVKQQMTTAVLAISAKVPSLRSRGLGLLLPCRRAITS